MLKKILAKMTETHKDWADKVPYALWGYKTSIRTAMGATPYSLVYGMEAILPIEMELRSLRVIAEAKLVEQEWALARREQLALLNEKRMRALYQTHVYHKRIARALNKKVRPNKIKEGDLVLKQSKP